MKKLIVLMMLISPAANAQTFHLVGGAVNWPLDYDALVNKRQLRWSGQNKCLEVVNTSQLRWTGCNNYVGQRWGTISNSLNGTYWTAVISHLNGRALTREDGLNAYKYTGRWSQLWALHPLRLGR